MYQVFDDFLETYDWKSFSNKSESYFYKALSRVVLDPLFSVSEMNDYFREYIYNRNIYGDEQVAVNVLADKAKAVHTYLKYIDP